MAMKTITVVFFLVLLSEAFIVKSLRSCTCEYKYTWDCSFLGKSVMLPGEGCYSDTWLFQHNKLQFIPRPSYLTMKVIDFSYNLLGFNESTSFFDWKIDHLDVSGNYLKKLGIVSGSTIETLVASDNEISDIEVINEVNVQYKLVLGRNKIKSIPANVFGSRMNYVDLSGNPLSSISADAFNGMFSLNILHLNSTQKLSKLENGTFSDLTSLEHLSLNNNKLKILPEDLFSTLKSLEELYLHVNNLRELPLGLFRSLYRLRVLNLDNNQLTELPEELFSRLHSLEELSVRHNNLIMVPVLRLCSGPLSTATFAGNHINRVDEAGVRALLRSGFLLADLSGNPVDEDSLSWVNDANDFVLRRGNTVWRTIEMSNATNHGIVSFNLVDTNSEDEFGGVKQNPTKQE